ncbi:MAG TPA: helix-turn-helix domain-containing protein, partial [Terrimicrobiaceae bacterium]
TVRRPSQIPESQPEDLPGLNLQQSERSLIFRALEESGGNRTEAARILGISRRTLHRRLRELNIIKNAAT